MKDKYVWIYILGRDLSRTSRTCITWIVRLEALPRRLEAIAIGWKPWLVGWTPSLLHRTWQFPISVHEASIQASSHPCAKNRSPLMEQEVLVVSDSFGLGLRSFSNFEVSPGKLKEHFKAEAGPVHQQTLDQRSFWRTNCYLVGGHSY